MERRERWCERGEKIEKGSDEDGQRERGRRQGGRGERERERKSEDRSRESIRERGNSEFWGRDVRD